MSSTRAFLCDLCIILFCGFTFIISAEKHPKSIMADKISGNCSCGGFPGQTYSEGTSPLLSQSPGLVVSCDEEGATTCKNLCTALAVAAKAKGPEILCSRLKIANELKLSVFYKICDEPWVFGNMSAEEPLCCEDYKSVICALKENNSTIGVLNTN